MIFLGGVGAVDSHHTAPSSRGVHVSTYCIQAAADTATEIATTTADIIGAVRMTVLAHIRTVIVTIIVITIIIIAIIAIITIIITIIVVITIIAIIVIVVHDIAAACSVAQGATATATAAAIPTAITIAAATATDSHRNDRGIRVHTSVPAATARNTVTGAAVYTDIGAAAGSVSGTIVVLIRRSVVMMDDIC